MRLVVGLGNPDEKYAQTRHNVGFRVVQKIAEKRRVPFRLEPPYESRFAEMGELDNRIKLVMPQTYMNESGRAVLKCKDYWKIDSEDIWVIHDDVDLDLGTVRISLGGSSAGHKGVQSIIDHLGPAFWRVRVGIGKSDQMPTENWVLAKFSPEQEKNISEVVDRTADFVLESLIGGIKEQTININ